MNLDHALRKTSTHKNHVITYDDQKLKSPPSKKNTENNLIELTKRKD